MRERGIGHPFKFITQNDSFAVEAYPGADMLRHQFVIAGKNLDFNSVTSQSEQRRLRALQRRIRESQKSREHQVLFIFGPVSLLRRNTGVSNRQHTKALRTKASIGCFGARASS